MNKQNKPFRLIIAGGRDFTNYKLLEEKVLSLYESSLKGYELYIVSGGARGADRLGERFAREHGGVPYLFPAEWDKYGKSAGFRRNQQMADFADGLLAFWDGESRGTKHMINCMEQLGKPVQIVYY